MNKKQMDAIFDAFKQEIEEIDKCETPCETTKCEHNFMYDDGIYICGHCSIIEYGITEPFIEWKDRPLPPSSPYEKLTHFKETIEILAGSNSICIPDEVMSVCTGIHQEEIKQTLQKHKLKRYYSCVYLIMRQKGIKIPTLLQNEKERLISLFKQIETIYNRIKRKKNMISYNFLLSRMLPMIGRKDLVPFLFELHSKRKLKEYDLLWKKMMTLL
jgi:hypothetical protein